MELPLGNDTYPANADEGSHFIAHCTALAIPVLPGQVQLGDAGYDVIVNYRWIRDQDGMPVIDYNPGLQALLPDNGTCYIFRQ